MWLRRGRGVRPEVGLGLGDTGGFPCITPSHAEELRRRSEFWVIYTTLVAILRSSNTEIMICRWGWIAFSMRIVWNSQLL